MSKKYVFEFNGTKQEFIKKLDLYPNSASYDGNKFYRFDDYIVEVVDNTMHFGVERTGHSGGFWFIPSITENENQIEFRGIVKYIGPEDDRSKIKKAINKIQEWLLYILLAPLVLLIYVGVTIFTFFKWTITKICRLPVAPKPKTTEEKLFDLMVNHLGCIRKETN